MFELNNNLEIKEELFQGTVIYTIDDFYRDPQQVENYLFRNISNLPLHKIQEKPSFNGIHFEDRRHPSKENFQLEKVYDFLSGLCGQSYEGSDLITNCARFKRHEFNDYENCHWWPHKDTGYNGIVYLMTMIKWHNFIMNYTTTSTLMNIMHHGDQKMSLNSFKHLEPKYNRLVFFDGWKFQHGMNISNDRYFGEEYRKNQVFFFDCEEFLEEEGG